MHCLHNCDKKRFLVAGLLSRLVISGVLYCLQQLCVIISDINVPIHSSILDVDVVAAYSELRKVLFLALSDFFVCLYMKYLWNC